MNLLSRQYRMDWVEAKVTRRQAREVRTITVEIIALIAAIRAAIT